MSAGDISENLRGRPGDASAPAAASSIADPIPVRITGFSMTTFVLS